MAELVIEDGTAKTNAESFVTLVETRAFALARGVTLSEDDDALTVLVTKSIDYVKSRRKEYDGTKLTETQALPFPRTGAYIDDVLVPDGTIPIEVKEFQNGVILAVNAGIDLFPTTQDRALKRKKTGPLESEWFSEGFMPTVSFIDSLIEPLLSADGQFALTVRRI